MVENPQLYINFDKGLYRISAEKISSISPDIDPDTLASGTIASIIGTKMNITGNDIYLFDNTTGGISPVTGDAATIFFPRNDDNTQRFIMRKRAGINYDDENVQEMLFDKAANNGRENYLFIGRAGEQNTTDSKLDVVDITTKEILEFSHYNSDSPLFYICNTDYSGAQTTGIMGMGTTGGTRQYLNFIAVGSPAVFTGSPDFDAGTTPIIGVTSGAMGYISSKTDVNNFVITGIDGVFSEGETVTQGAKSGILSSIILRTFDPATGDGGGATMFGQNFIINGNSYGGIQMWLDAYDIYIADDLIPYEDNYRSLGNATHRFKNVWLSGLPTEDDHAATKEYVDNASASTGEFIYGELIEAEKAIFIGDGGKGTTIEMLDDGGADEDWTFGRGNADWHAKAHQGVDDADYYPVPNIKYVTVRLKKVGAPADNVTISITSYDGATVYGSGTIANASIGAGYANIECTLSTAVTTPSTDFCIQLERTGALDNDNYFCVSYISGGVLGGSYAIGYYDGANWSNSAPDMKYLALTPNYESGKTYKSDSSNINKAKFSGFTIDAGDIGDTGTVQLNGIMAELGGLTAGSKYYISDTAGAISSTIGTSEKLVGIAVSTTTLLILPTEHWEYLGHSANTGLNGNGSITGVPAQCNFIICALKISSDLNIPNYYEFVLNRVGKTTAEQDTQVGGDVSLTFDTANNEIDYAETGGFTWTMTTYYYS